MSARKVLTLLSIGLCVLCFGVQVAGQSVPVGSATTDTGLGGVNSITGTILGASGQRIQRRVSIRLQTMTRGDRLTTSDEYGNFAFRGLVSGDYTVVINKEEGFEPFSQTVSIIQPRGFPPVSQLMSIRLI